MRVLMVGCGAVGQVLGLFLARSGVELCFYARPGSADRLRQAQGHGGLPLFRVSRLHSKAPKAYRLEGYSVVSDVFGSQRFGPDQIWFTTPSPVYHSEWFRAFVRQVPSKRVVCFAPEGGRPDLIPDGVGEDRFVFGGVTFMAWQGDLEGGGGRPEAVNFWLAPGLGIPLIGEGRASAEVAETLERAGLRSDVQKPDYGATQAAVTALLSAFVAGLELSGWSFGAFRRSPWLKRAARGAQEAVMSQLGDTGSLTRLLLGIPLSSAGLFLATFLLPFFPPFDLEKYLKFHYLKTRDQTLALLGLFADDGNERGLPVESIRILLRGLQDQTTSVEELL